MTAKTDKQKSKIGRMLAKLRWSKTPVTERKKHGKMLADARQRAGEKRQREKDVSKNDKHA